MNSNCDVCDEQRCKKHCKCGRTKSVKAQGRSGPRGRGADTDTARPAARVRQTSEAVAPVAPVGRAPAPSCQLLEVEDFYSQCCADVGAATEVELASYLYDDPALQKVLLRRLKGRSVFSLNIFLDEEQFAARVAKFQRSRVKALWDAGAQVFLCRGSKAQGAFHSKGMVVDRRYLYSGGANFTYKSHLNEELCFRITGPVVGQVLAKLSAQKAKRRPWDGA